MARNRKFLLDYPYFQDWTYGTVVINPEGRRNILLTKPKEGNSKRGSTVSYARYLYAVHLGRYLDKSEHVDHINGNKLDDFISNLQIVNSHENNLKSAIERNRTRVMAELTCPACGVIFNKPYNQTHFVKGGLTTSCSRKCASKVSNKDKSFLKSFGENQLLRKYRFDHHFEKEIGVSKDPKDSTLRGSENSQGNSGGGSEKDIYDYYANRSEKKKLRKVERPSKIELLKLINSGIPWVQIGQKFGVSDNAVRKWASSYGINYEKRGYTRKSI